MIEQTREIVRKFNSLYGEVLVEPEALLGDYPRLVGLDGKAKMSKSLGNCIFLADSAEEVQKKVMSMYTDPTRLKPTDPGTVEGNPVFIYHEAFNPNKEEIEDLKNRYRAGTVGDVEVKQKLIIAINNLLEPMRVRRAELASNPEKIEAILKDGVEKGKVITGEVLAKAKEAMKINYNF